MGYGAVGSSPRSLSVHSLHLLPHPLLGLSFTGFCRKGMRRTTTNRIGIVWVHIWTSINNGMIATRMVFGGKHASLPTRLAQSAFARTGPPVLHQRRPWKGGLSNTLKCPDNNSLWNECNGSLVCDPAFCCQCVSISIHLD